jgi:hypothetical protein
MNTGGRANERVRESVKIGLLLKSPAIAALFEVAATCGLLLFPRQEVSVIILHSFSGGEGGRTPSASLAQGKDGTLFGATWEGGPETVGMLFGISRERELRVLYPRTGTSLIAGE